VFVALSLLFVGDDYPRGACSSSSSRINVKKRVSGGGRLEGKMSVPTGRRDAVVDADAVVDDEIYTQRD
jgi:hypothetical protein